MTNPVVVGVDSTGRSLKALMWAAHRAALHGVPLRVVHALPRYEGDSHCSRRVASRKRSR